MAGLRREEQYFRIPDATVCAPKTDDAAPLSRVPSPIVQYFSSGASGGAAAERRERTLAALAAKLASPPRIKRCYKRGRSGEREEVAQQDPKQDAQRAAKRMRSAFHKVQSALGERCCEGGCLQRLDEVDVVSWATLHAAQDFATRETMLLERLRACWTESNEHESDGLCSTESHRRNIHRAFALRLFGRKVCTKAFAPVHGLHVRSLERKMKELLDPSSLRVRLPIAKVHGNRGRAAGELQRTRACKEWLRSLRANFAQPFPDKQVRDKATGSWVTKEFLPTGLFPCRASVYRYYAADERCAGRTPVSEATFRRVWADLLFMVSGNKHIAAQRQSVILRRNSCPAVGAIGPT